MSLFEYNEFDIVIKCVGFGFVGMVDSVLYETTLNGDTPGLDLVYIVAGWCQRFLV